MIRSQPALEHLTGVPIKSTSDYRTCVHIQTDARTLNLHWGLRQPYDLGGFTGRGDLIPAWASHAHMRKEAPAPIRSRRAEMAALSYARARCSGYGRASARPQYAHAVAETSYA